MERFFVVFFRYEHGNDLIASLSRAMKTAAYDIGGGAGAVERLGTFKTKRNAKNNSYSKQSAETGSKTGKSSGRRGRSQTGKPRPAKTIHGLVRKGKN